VTSATTAAADAEIAQIAIGAVADPNFPGSSEAKIPDQTDWANFVGSLAYTLLRLHDRVVGPGR
jgi:phospholipid/cholesterol/gamma-HCH transport system substrate-binding protein